MTKINDLDKIDLQILSFLMDDAKMPYTEIAKILFISSGTVHVRMKKMEELGVIKSSNLHVNYEKLGYDITAFIGVHLRNSNLYNMVAKQMEAIPEIVNVHYTTGEYSMFIKIVCKDTRHLRTVLHDKIQKIDEISRTETFISLEESIHRSVRIDIDDESNNNPVE
ncbi:MAG: Lrp/AsnC ligand binding domain-containing protein [Chitinophagales bacterium]|nr:Lrp/AsnC ligand binding domain-containing protein [Chitinophagales bacterium]MCZ2393154.1 Lrp/AsnC ligand binding domain-containing protein [Chitinophagales bacterium]